jgi:hypothetical protein
LVPRKERLKLTIVSLLCHLDSFLRVRLPRQAVLGNQVHRHLDRLMDRRKERSSLCFPSLAVLYVYVFSSCFAIPLTPPYSHLFLLFNRVMVDVYSPSSVGRTSPPPRSSSSSLFSGRLVTLSSRGSFFNRFFGLQRSNVLRSFAVLLLLSLCLSLDDSETCRSSLGTSLRRPRALAELLEPRLFDPFLFPPFYVI